MVKAYEASKAQAEDLSEPKQAAAPRRRVKPHAGDELAEGKADR
jgi:hypothetical protein